MRRLLLVSSSSVHGSGYLEHCEAEIRRLFAEAGVETVLFVPFALGDRDGYAEKARRRFAEMGLALESIHSAPNAVAAVEEAQGLFIGGGNTFRLLTALYQRNLIEPIRRRAREGMPYLGTSAGANVACPTVMTTNDMPIVYPPSFESLGLVSFQINAHYLDPDPASTHMGETRDVRLREYHEENANPVIALREGTMLVVADESVRLEGKAGGKLFRAGEPSREIAGGARLDELLAPAD